MKRAAIVKYMKDPTNKFLSSEPDPLGGIVNKITTLHSRMIIPDTPLPVTIAFIQKLGRIPPRPNALDFAKVCTHPSKNKNMEYRAS